MFFVISGFIISNLIFIKHETENFSLKEFYLSRLKRILPAYLALLTVVSILAAIVYIPSDFSSYLSSLRSALTFTSNNYFSHYYDYFGPQAYELPLLHTWSLAIEIQYYLLAPIILISMPRSWRLPATLTLVVIFTIHASYQLHYKANHTTYYSLLARIPEFLIGTTAALLRPPLKKTWENFAYLSGLLLVISSFLIINESLPFPGLFALPPCIGTALIIWSKKTISKNWLNSPPLVKIGNLSYSLYLWHWPILAGFKYYYGKYTLPAGTITVALALIFSASYLSYRWIEIPVRQAKLNRSHILRIFTFTILMLGTILLAHLINLNITKPTPIELTRYADPKTICHSKIVGDCVRGDRAGKRDILMIGDSHAAQLNLFADVIGNFMHVRIRVITASNCVTINGFDFDRIPEDSRAPCLSQIKEIDKLLPTTHEIILAGNWDYQLKSPAFIAALHNFLNVTHKKNKRVYILTQVPSLTNNLQRAIKFKSLGLNPITQKNPNWEKANLEVEQISKKYSNVTILDYSHIDLFKNAPFFEDVPLYLDSDHINEVGSLLYGEAVKQSISQVLLQQEPTVDRAQ